MIENNFMGKEGQSVPEMNDEWLNTISKRYIELYEQIIGVPFTPTDLSNDEIFDKILKELL